MNGHDPRPLGVLLALGLLLVSSSAPAEILTPAEVMELTHSARLDLTSSSGAAKTEASLQSALERGLSEPDPPRREAMLSVWLREWIGPEPLIEPRASDLQLLAEFVPVVEVVHHEHPERSMPAFNVAGHARNRLEEQGIRRLADTLKDQPDAIEKALSAPVDSRTFRAGLRAATQASPELRKELTGLFQQKRGRNADASTLLLVEHGLIGPEALLDVIAFAPAPYALQAVRRIDDLDGDARAVAITTALERPELGGLPVSLAARFDAAESTEQLWTLLDDPGRGADAALALARGMPDLAAQIDQRFDAATPRARLRMLLALELDGSSSSRTLLADLREDRLTALERRATEAWE